MAAVAAAAPGAGAASPRCSPVAPLVPPAAGDCLALQSPSEEENVCPTDWQGMLLIPCEAWSKVGPVGVRRPVQVWTEVPARGLQVERLSWPPLSLATQPPPAGYRGQGGNQHAAPLLHALKHCLVYAHRCSNK